MYSLRRFRPSDEQALCDLLFDNVCRPLREDVHGAEFVRCEHDYVRESCDARTGDMRHIDSVYELFVVAHLADDADQRPCGMVALQRHAPDHYELRRMHVAASQHGRGLGSALLSLALAWVRERSPVLPCALRLSTMAHYAAANALYAKHGFVVTRVEPAYPLDPLAHLVHYYELTLHADTRPLVVLAGGGRTGIGRAAVAQLRQRGDVRVWWTTRDAVHAHACADPGALVLDVLEPASVDAFVQRVAAARARVVVLCAAVGIAEGEFDRDSAERVMHTNLFGLCAVADQLLLKQQLPLRLVFVSSRRAQSSLIVGDPDTFARRYLDSIDEQHSWIALRYSPQVYMISKALLNHKVRQLAASGVCCCGCCPGRCATPLTQFQDNLNSPELGAQVIVDLCTAPSIDAGAFYTSAHESQREPW